METSKLEIVPVGIESVTFKIGDVEKNLQFSTIREVIDHLTNLYKFMDFYRHYVKMYKDYDEAKIDAELDKEESEFDAENKEYMAGVDFEPFCRLLDDDTLKTITNDNAEKIFKPEYEKVYGKSTLKFYPEREFCDIYTSDRLEAKQFLLFTYNKIIKSALDKAQS